MSTSSTSRSASADQPSPYGSPSSQGPAPQDSGADRPLRRVRVHHVAQAKAQGRRMTMLTAYDAVTAAVLDAAGTDMLLVGDSIGNVMLGHGSTLPVSLEEMLVATRAVASAATRALVVADLPFGTYEAGPQQALTSAVRLVKAGAHAVKLEGGASRAQTVGLLVQAGIPVCGHIGFTPQSVNALGGYRVQGREEPDAQALLRDAEALSQAGVFAMVLEMVPAEVAGQITRTVEASTIGIGAGAQCDAQVLVWTDMAGMSDFKARFVRRFGQVGQALRQAAGDYNEAVRQGTFPSAEESF